MSRIDVMYKINKFYFTCGKFINNFHITTESIFPIHSSSSDVFHRVKYIRLDVFIITKAAYFCNTLSVLSTDFPCFYNSYALFFYTLFYLSLCLLNMKILYVNIHTYFLSDNVDIFSTIRQQPARMI